MRTAAIIAALVAIPYAVLLTMNMSAGYCRCRAVAVHEIVYDDLESISRLSPCWMAYQIRG